MSHYIFGVQSVRPITNLPDGARVRLRLRAEEFATAYVRYGNRIERWGLRDSLDGTWMLDLKHGENVSVGNH